MSNKEPHTIRKPQIADTFPTAHENYKYSNNQLTDHSITTIITHSANASQKRLQNN